jgi:hypothetical protein
VNGLRQIEGRHIRDDHEMHCPLAVYSELFKFAPL